MSEVARSTRFYCASNPPPHLDAVCKRIDRVLRKGCLPDLRSVRAIAVRADSFYSDRGKADDLQRFLRNEGILIEDAEDDNKLYYDAERAAVVIASCENHTQPPPAPENRLAKLKVDAAHQLKSPRLVEAATDEEPDFPPEPEGAPEDEDPPDEQTAAGAETPGADQEASPSLSSPTSEELWEICIPSDDELGAMSTPGLEKILAESERQRAVLNQLISRARAEQARRIEKRLAEIEEMRQHLKEELSSLDDEGRALVKQLPTTAKHR